MSISIYLAGSASPDLFDTRLKPPGQAFWPQRVHKRAAPACHGHVERAQNAAVCCLLLCAGCQ
eukprot:scaffold6562_cov120-Isochrysis_galbana.AAC.13